MKRFLLAVLFLSVLVSCKKTLVGEEKYREQARIDDEIIQQYIADNSLDAQRVDTTGVFYVVVNPGTGNSTFTNSTVVTVGAKTRILTTGELIDETGRFHPSFSLGGSIIKAWQLGIPNVQEGGTVRILSPSRYAYGPYDQPTLGIPANSVLDFEITLYDIQN